MERSSWNFRTVKQLVTQNVSINFCPHKPEIRNSETMINLAGPPRWQLCGAPEEWPANCVLHVSGVLIHCPSDRRQRHTQTRELGGSTCEYNKPSMRSTASLGLGGCQWACFLPFRTVVYFSRLERNKMLNTEKESYFFNWVLMWQLRLLTAQFSHFWLNNIGIEKTLLILTFIRGTWLLSKLVHNATQLTTWNNDQRYWFNKISHGTISENDATVLPSFTVMQIIVFLV